MQFFREFEFQKMQTLLIGLTLLVSCKYKTDERAGILFLWKYSIIALVLNFIKVGILRKMKLKLKPT